MIRKSTVSLKNINQNKKETLDLILNESKRVINSYIDELWKRKEFKLKFVDFKVDSWLSARMLQVLGKQASEIVKSQRKRKRKTKPIFNSSNLTLDSKVISLYSESNSFDLWFKLSSIGNKIKLHLPANKHFHCNKFNNWKKRKSFRLFKRDDVYYITIFFEKETPKLKTKGKSKGVDIGYKKLIVSSDGEFLGNSTKYEKISNKQQGSKAFKRSLKERDEDINIQCKSLDLEDVKTLYVEDLKNVKKNTKKRIYKKFNNKLQRWLYPKVLDKLSLICEEKGIELVRIPPYYTSQRCSKCGEIHKSS